jgi:hypothetical protein
MACTKHCTADIHSKTTEEIRRLKLRVVRGSVDDGEYHT